MPFFRKKFVIGSALLLVFAAALGFYLYRSDWFLEPALPRPDNDPQWLACAQEPNRHCILDRALRTAQAIREHGARYYRIRKVAETNARLGRFPEALRVAELIKDHSRSSALSLIAEMQAQQGLFQDASGTVQKISGDGYARTYALAAIGREQAKVALMKQAGDTFSVATNVADSIRDPSQRSSAILAIADAQAKSGMNKEATESFHKAVQSAKSITAQWSRFLRLLSIVESQAALGFFDEDCGVD